jgi:hypothetical protein
MSIFSHSILCLSLPLFLSPSTPLPLYASVHVIFSFEPLHASLPPLPTSTALSSWACPGRLLCRALRAFSEHRVFAV